MRRTLHSENMAEVPQLFGRWVSLESTGGGQSVRPDKRARPVVPGRSGRGGMTSEDTTGMNKNGRIAFGEDMGRESR